jgi:hypothetical protein
MTQDFENKTTVPAADRRQPGWHPPLPEKIPEPTVWPFVLALGATLLAWGVVTSWMISVVGMLLFAAGMGGWIAEMRHDQS